WAAQLARAQRELDELLAELAQLLSRRASGPHRLEAELGILRRAQGELAEEAREMSRSAPTDETVRRAAEARLAAEQERLAQDAQRLESALQGSVATAPDPATAAALEGARRALAQQP